MPCDVCLYSLPRLFPGKVTYLAVRDKLSKRSPYRCRSKRSPYRSLELIQDSSCRRSSRRRGVVVVSSSSCRRSGRLCIVVDVSSKRSPYRLPKRPPQAPSEAVALPLAEAAPRSGRPTAGSSQLPRRRPHSFEGGLGLQHDVDLLVEAVCSSSRQPHCCYLLFQLM